MWEQSTHTFSDLTLKLVEYDLYGLHIRLELFDVLRGPRHRRRENRAQVKPQDVVHGLARERALKEEQSLRMQFIINQVWHNV